METEQLNLDFQGKKMVIHKVKNWEELITDPTDPDKVPCWAEIWPASIGLARYLYQERELSAKTAIELGAGLGVPGIMAGLKGAHITFSDFNQQALDFCHQNARANGLTKYDTLLADWRSFPRELHYDIVLGSDIVYEPRLLSYLENVFTGFLNGRSEILLAHPSRKVTYAFVEELAGKLKKENRVQYLEVTVEDSLLTNYRIAVHSIK